jgi:hypothetical protein
MTIHLPAMKEVDGKRRGIAIAPAKEEDSIIALAGRADPNVVTLENKVYCISYAIGSTMERREPKLCFKLQRSRPRSISKG